MPNNILITPGSASIQFSGSATNTIRLQVEPSGSVAFYGNSGSLFSITDSLVGSLMSVNDISGLPILEVFSDDRVVMGTFNRNTLVVTGSRVGIDKANPSTDLDVSGSVFITGSLGISGSGINFVGTGTTATITSNAFGDQLNLPTVNVGGTNFQLTNNGLFTRAVNTNVNLGALSLLRWTSTGDSATGIVDIILARDASGTLAQRSASNAQTFRIYNTFTDASNYERGKLEWSGNIFNIGTEQSGSGAARNLALQTSGSTRIFISSSGDVGVNTTTPAYRFDVEGAIRATGTGGGVSYWLDNNRAIRSTAGAGAITYLDLGTANFRDGNGASTGAKINVYGDGYFAGRVGIGTTAPSASLHIQGNISASSYTSSISNAVGFVGTASFAVSASWAPGVGTSGVSSITAGDGLTGGTITSTGTITLDTSSVHFLDGVKKELNTEGVISSSTQFTSLTAPFTGSFTGSFIGQMTGTSSYAQNANLLDGLDSTVFATTGSNTFIGSNLFSGSVTIQTNNATLVINDTDSTVRYAGINLTHLGGTWYLSNGDNTSTGTNSDFWIGRSFDSTNNRVRVARDAYTLSVYSGSNENVVLNATGSSYFTGGSVGIGTSSPASILDISQATNDAVLRVRSTGAGAYIMASSNDSNYFGFILASGSSITTTNDRWFIGSYGGPGDLTFTTGRTGTEYMRIVRSTGRVGIGTTSPAALLQISASGATNDLLIGNTTTPKLFVSASGNVGIGDTAPSDKLVINGRTRISGTSVLAFGDSPGGQAWIGITNSTVGTLTFRTYDGSSFVERMRIVNTTGNVGINTAAPSASLHVSASGTTNDLLVGDTITPKLFVSASGDVAIGTTSTGARLRVIGSGSNAAGAYIGAGTDNYFDAQNTVFRLSNQSETMRINSSGNVGISTTSPAARLHISASGATNDLLVGTAATPKLLVTDTGSIGIGIVPSNWWAGIRAIQFGQRGNLQSSNNTVALGFNSLYDTSSNFRYIASDYALEYRLNSANGSHAWFIAPQGTAGNTISFTQAMTLDASGSLGVNIAAPYGRVHIRNGSSGVPSASVNANALVVESNQSNGVAVLLPATSTGYYAFGDPTDNRRGGIVYALSSQALGERMEFWVGGAGGNRMTILPTGNVGIGTAAPSASLHVQGNVSASSYTSSISNAVGFVGTSSWAQSASVAVSSSFSPVGPGTVNSIALFNASNAISSSNIVQSGNNIGIGITSPQATLQVSGSQIIDGGLTVYESGSSVWPITAGYSTRPTSTYIRVNASASTFRGFEMQTAGTRRWLLYTDNATETGANVGSTFNIGAYNDAGSFIDAPITIERKSNGLIYFTRTLRAITGSNTSPTIAPTDGYGITFPNTTNIGFVINSSEAMRIDSNRNVGIGTTSPSASLHVVRSSTSGITALIENTQGSPVNNPVVRISRLNNIGSVTPAPSASGLHIIEHSSNPALYVESHTNSPLLFVSGSGNVGIGNSAPGAKLHIEGGSANWNESIPGGTRGTIHLDPGVTTDDFGNAITFGASDFGNGESSQAGIYVRTDGAYGSKMYLATSNNYGTGATTRLYIAHDGNIGIGTTSPTAKLHVTGSTGGVFEVDGVNGTNALYVSASGNVGVGIVSPSASLHVSGSTIITGAVTASTALISGSGTQRLTVIGSGSAQPLFTVQGSQGELFSIVDNLSGSLFSVNDISGLPILEVFSDDTVLMGDYLAPALNTTKRLTLNTASNVIYSIPTASYDSIHIEYNVKSGSNGRAGNFIGTYVGSSVQFTDTSTLSVGSTTNVKFESFISGANLVVTGSVPTNGWTCKAIIRAI